MCCCCVTVSLNLLANLVQRITDDIMELIYCQRRHCLPSSSGSSLSMVVEVAAEDQYQCHDQRPPPYNDDQPPPLIKQQQQRDEDPAPEREAKDTDLPQEEGLPVECSFYNVIYDTVELEPFYYRDVDRLQSEEMLRGTSDGSCLVRPFKMKHPHIRYILSVHASGAYFHLFIRLTAPHGMYALGLVKSKERHFKFPSDIVQYYRTHWLECTSSATGHVKIKLHLLPIDNWCQTVAPREPEGVVIT